MSMPPNSADGRDRPYDWIHAVTPIVGAAHIRPARARRLVGAAGTAWRSRRDPSTVQVRKRLRLHRIHLRRARRREWRIRQAARWGQTRRPLFTVGGFAAFTVGAWQLHPVAGLFMLGLSLWLYDWLARPRNTSPR